MWCLQCGRWLQQRALNTELRQRALNGLCAAGFACSPAGPCRLCWLHHKLNLQKPSGHGHCTGAWGQLCCSQVLQVILTLLGVYDGLARHVGTRPGLQRSDLLMTYWIQGFLSHVAHCNRCLVSQFASCSLGMYQPCLRYLASLCSAKLLLSEGCDLC